MSETLLQANPLYAFRAPKEARGRHPHVDGAYFTTQRADVTNDVGMLNIYPRTFRYIPDPTLEVDMTYVEDNPTDMRVQAHFINMMGREGFNLCKPEEWEILDPAVATIWKSDGNGRLTIKGANSHTMALVWRTGEAAAAAEVRRRRANEEISKTPEQMEAELGDKNAQLRDLGASIQVSLEDDDGSNTPPAVRRKR